MRPSDNLLDVERETSEFIEALAASLVEILGEEGLEPFSLDVTEKNEVIRAAARTAEAGIPLTVEGRQILRLTAQYRFAQDSRNRYLKTESSAFTVYPMDSSEPLLHYDYVHEPAGDIPAAHINIHAHRDEALFALYLSNRQRAARRHMQAEKGKPTKLSEIHLPVGGHRFRPCLEDVVEMLILEFGLDHQHGWREAVRHRREEWRRKQLKAAVWDDPASARAALAEFDAAALPEAIRTARVHAL